MKTKTENNYKMTESGIDIIISSVQLKKVPGTTDDWYPAINQQALLNLIFKALAETPQRLMGLHIKYIRKFMNRTQEEFAKDLSFTSPKQIRTWEQKGRNPADILPIHEANLKLLMMDFQGIQTLNVKNHLLLSRGKIPHIVALIKLEEKELRQA